jgi:Family of unknown function (DUF5678)
MSDHNGEMDQLSDVELDRLRDAEWALRDLDVQRQFEGQWVVAYQRRIIAHGDDPKAVAQSAIRVTGDQGHRLVFCARDDPDRWFDSSSDIELANG